MYANISALLCGRDTRVQTVVLRGSTPCVLDEAEKAVDDACAFAKALTKDRRFVAGAGAAEMEIARKLQVRVHTCSCRDKAPPVETSLIDRQQAK